MFEYKKYTSLYLTLYKKSVYFLGNIILISCTTSLKIYHFMPFQKTEVRNVSFFCQLSKFAAVLLWEILSSAWIYLQLTVIICACEGDSDTKYL